MGRHADHDIQGDVEKIRSNIAVTLAAGPETMPLSYAAVGLGVSMARHLRGTDCKIDAVAKTWGQSMITTASMMASIHPPGSTALRVITPWVNTQSVAGYYLFTGLPFPEMRSV